MLLLALALTIVAGCGQKGDLYRPGKSQKLAANSEASSQF
jgi:predicted small lipoprotein YifL